MVLIAQARRNNLFFGTLDKMDWFPTPLSGAEVSPSGWGADGTLLNGGGFALNSFGSHKRYIFEWPQSSSREVSQLMKSYADGTYGRGLIYFVDPLIYDTNTLPAMWADPSMGIGYEGSSLVYGLEASAIPTNGWAQNNLPVQSAYYDLQSVATGWRGTEHAVFLPIPEGYNLALGSFHSQSGAGEVFYREQATNGALGAISVLSGMSNSSSVVVDTVVPGSGIRGVWLYVGKSAPGAGSVTMTAMTARLFRSNRSISEVEAGPWIGGQGHSGCRFVGKPTYINNTGVDGGQVSFAASFVEVGSWLYG